MLALVIIALVMIQRSEGGGLGIGGGGGGLGQFASARSTANVLTRATGIAAAGFFATSLLLAVLASSHARPKGILESVGTQPPASAAALEQAPPAAAEGAPAAEATVPETPEPPTVPIAK